MKKILIHKSVYYSVLLVLVTLIAGGCKKEKLNNKIPLPDVANQSPSSIRMFNFTGGNAGQVTVNNIPLTIIGNNPAISGGTQIGLAVFPTGQWTGGDDGSPFTLPNSLLDKDGKAHVIISGGAIAVATTDTIIVNDVAHPRDYYLMADGHLKALDRNNLPPSNPQNFKIRIINLGASVDPLALNGPVSLTYADGSQVDPALNNVAQGISSGYAEVPYGSFQFKLFVADGAINVTKQLAEIPSLPRIDACHLTTIQAQEGISPRVRTFKPGGVYSIVISQNAQRYLSCDGQNAILYSNSYRVITELDPGVNSTYAHMQAVNAIPGKQVSILVDGKALGDHLPYIGSVISNVAQNPPYQIYIQGSHHIQAVENGTVLAEGELTLYPYDNYTIWAYNKPDGKPAVLFEANDMSGTVYTSTYHPDGVAIPDDGTNGLPRRTQFNYALESRFLNLSTDVPYVTFTNDHQLLLPATGDIVGDTVRNFDAYVNLAPGIMPASNSSIIYSLQPFAGAAIVVHSEFGIVPNLIRAYQSKPGNPPNVPGTLLTDITPVDVLQTFVANQNLYTTPLDKTAETGVYTVAIVGKAFTASQASEKARLIVIKHNK